MKFLCERNALKDAISVVIGRTKIGGQNPIPILQHILIQTDGQKIKLTGNDLDSCSEVTIPAEVDKPGSIAIPGDQFAKLVGGFAEGMQFKLDADERVAHLRCGRSSYKLHLLKPEDFPAPLAPNDPVSLTLTAKQIGRLFGTPQSSISNEATRFYLCGIFLHVLDGKLAGCATNGHTLIRATIDIEPPTFEPVIVPDRATQEIIRVSGSEEEVTLLIGKNALAVHAGGRKFVTKLIDATFPDYTRALPRSEAGHILIDCEPFDAALARLAAACDRDKTPIAKITWDETGAELVASLRSGVGSGEEEIECECPLGAPKGGVIGMQIDYVRDMMESLGASRVRLFITEKNAPVRFENPDDTDLLGVVMPCDVK
jgi:DNA polymerase-3 subunit beta